MFFTGVGGAFLFLLGIGTAGAIGISNYGTSYQSRHDEEFLATKRLNTILQGDLLRHARIGSAGGMFPYDSATLVDEQLHCGVRRAEQLIIAAFTDHWLTVAGYDTLFLYQNFELGIAAEEHRDLPPIYNMCVFPTYEELTQEYELFPTINRFQMYQFEALKEIMKYWNVDITKEYIDRYENGRDNDYIC